MQVHYAPCLAGAMAATNPVPSGRGAVSSTGTSPFQGEQSGSARKRTFAVLVQAACLSCAAPSVRGVEHPAEVRGLYCMEVVDNALLIVAGQMLQDNTLAEFSGSHTRKSGAPDTLDKLRYESISDKTTAALLIVDSGIGTTKKALGEIPGNELQDKTFRSPAATMASTPVPWAPRWGSGCSATALRRSPATTPACNAPMTLGNHRSEFKGTGMTNNQHGICFSPTLGSARRLAAARSSRQARAGRRPVDLRRLDPDIGCGCGFGCSRHPVVLSKQFQTDQLSSPFPPDSCRLPVPLSFPLCG